MKDKTPFVYLPISYSRPKSLETEQITHKSRSTWYILDYPSREICTAPTVTDAWRGYVWVDASRLSISRKIGNESEQVGLSR